MTAPTFASGASELDNSTGPAPVSDALHTASLRAAGVLRPRPDVRRSLSFGTGQGGQGMSGWGVPTNRNARAAVAAAPGHDQEGTS